MKNRELALMYSGGQFDAVSAYMSPHIEWHIYEDDQHLKGKIAVMNFAGQISNYFKTVDTQFDTSGIIEEANRIAVYGHAVFKRKNKILSSVNSCDIYEFDDKGFITKVYSYCNSIKG